MTSRMETVAPRVGVVGPGRLGTALVAGLRGAGIDVDGPAGRGEVPRGDAIVLCVPDSEIGTAAVAVAGKAKFIGHTSGATPLAAVEPAAAGAFALHPLQTFTADSGPELFRGAGCAIAGATPEALDVARSLAEALGMEPFEVQDEGRPAYHAAASIASNFLVTLQHAAEEVASGAGLEGAEARALLAPLVRRSVENWASLGPERALTGPVARGDDATVAAQRRAIAETAPHLLPFFDELVERTRDLAGVAA
jgi:predicted short-subunit dehydrogenase-like oxidoreductase (DUF2520 family)